MAQQVRLGKASSRGWASTSARKYGARASYTVIRLAQRRVVVRSFEAEEDITLESIVENAPEETPALYTSSMLSTDPIVAPADATPSYTEDDGMSAADVKAALLDSFYGTDRGLTARSEVRAEINELISQLEAYNPTPMPTQALDKLSGEWKLVYTSNSDVIAFLALSKLGPLTLGDIVQRIDGEKGQIENRLQVSGPLSSTTLSTVASFDVQSGKRVKVQFETGKFKTEPVFETLTLPSTVSIFGQAVDVTPLTSAINPVFEQAVNLLSDLGAAAKNQPDFQFPLPTPPTGQVSTWLLTTYLDDDLRIARGDGGSVFVLTKA